VIGQFKTMPGLVDYCIIQSFMDTCRKQGHNPFDMMRVILSGGDIIEAVFGIEKAGLLRQMIMLTDTIATGDINKINAAKVEFQPILSEELLAAASYGRFKAYNDPPPENKKTSTGVPKDKMQAAREKCFSKKPSATLSENSPPKNTKKCKARASPISA
jgi:hypothetical protein